MATNTSNTNSTNSNNKTNNSNSASSTSTNTNLSMTNKTDVTTGTNAQEMTFQIQRVYTKDISFESPSAPQIFQREWTPELQLDIDTSSSSLDEKEGLYEVVLRVTVKGTLKTETAFVCEVTQAGIFTVTGLEGNSLAHCLSAYCPTILFPYVRACVSSLVNHGTFPQLNLAPINFDALFENYLRQQQQTTTTSAKTEETVRA